MEHPQVVIKFNIGGTRYEVSQSLLHSYPDSMLAKCAADQWHSNPDCEIFIDRDGEQFRFVLNYLRDGKVHLPLVVTKESLLLDLKFYGIEVIKEDAIVEMLDSSHFGKYFPLVQDVMKSWKQEKSAIDKRSGILENCINIVEGGIRVNGYSYLCKGIKRSAFCTFTTCNEELLMKLGVSVAYELVYSTTSNDHIYEVGLTVPK